MDQTLFNIAVASCGALGGWWLKAMWSEIKELQRGDKQLADRVAAIDVLVAGQYLKRSEIVPWLERIESKLDRKVDK